MAYSSTHFTDELWPLRMPMDQNRSDSEQADLWTYQFEVPFETFTASWITDNVPPRGGACPSEIASTDNVVLNRYFAYRDIPGSVVVVLTCGWGGYVAGDIPAADATLDKYFVSKPEDVHAAYYASQQWILLFEIPIAIYTTAWVAANLPDAGAVPSAAMKALVAPAVDGTLLHRRVGYWVKPNYVGITLVYGWRSVYFDSLTRVSVRPVTVRKKLTVDTSDDPLDGPKAEHEEDQRHAVAGDQYEDQTYYQITVISVLTPAEMTSVASAFNGNENKSNTATVTLNKVTYGAGSVKFVGLGSETVVASQSPNGSAAYRSIISLMVSADAWRTVVKRYLETRLIQRVPVNEGTTLVGHARIGAWVRGTSGTEKTIRTTFDMTTALALLPGLGDY